MSNARSAAGSPGALILVAVALAVLVLGATAAASPVATAVLLGLALFAAAASLPLWLLPSVSLWLFALLPIGYLVGVPVWFARFWTPAAIVLAVWVIRVAATRGRHAFVRGLRWMVPLAAVLLPMSFVGLSSTRSVNWIAILFVGVALPTALVPASDERTASTLLRSWFLLGTGLSLVAVLEYLVQGNPLQRYYTFEQHWSLYRVTTTLGHPLANGTFFAVTACLAAFSLARRGGPRAAASVCFVLSALAASLTGSRSGVYALVCGLGVGLLVMLVSGRTSMANKLLGVLLGVTALVVLPALPSIAGRAASAEGTASSLYRDEVVRLAGRLFLEHPWFGYGPGTSAIATARAGATLPLENAVLGTVVSVGVVGTLALLVLVVLVLVRVTRGQRPDGIAAVAAFVVAGSAFPLWEGNPAALVLVGFVVIATRASRPVAEDDAVVPRLTSTRHPARPTPAPTLSAG